MTPAQCGLPYNGAAPPPGVLISTCTALQTPPGRFFLGIAFLALLFLSAQHLMWCLRPSASWWQVGILVAVQGWILAGNVLTPCCANRLPANVAWTLLTSGVIHIVCWLFPERGAKR